MRTTTEHTVVAVNGVDRDLFVLELERDGLDFVPGDCVALFSDAETSRPYSIASGNRENTLRFLIRRMEGGEVSPWLTSRKPGQVVRLSAPFGWFRPGQDIGASPFVFIATGTGVAPFLSYRHSFPQSPPDVILYGVQKEIHAIGLDQCKGWCNVRTAVSREQTSRHHCGRVTDFVGALAVTPETRFYLCGLESMVNEVSALLQQEGVDLFHIHREVFFYE